MTIFNADLAQCIKVAACAYDFVAEKQNPSPDHMMIMATWDRLEKAVDGLPVELRRLLAAEAGR